MQIKQKKENGIALISPRGRLDAETAPEAEQLLKANVGKEKVRLIFDLCDLDYISSAGMRLILQISKKVHAKGGQVVLCSLNDFVREVIGSSMLPIATSVAAAKKMFA